MPVTAQEVAAIKASLELRQDMLSERRQLLDRARQLMRASRDLTMDELAVQYGTTKKTIARISRGETFESIETDESVKAALSARWR